MLQDAASAYNTVCVTGDGSVFVFGNNYSGQLGVGDTENRLVPTLLSGDLENKLVLQVAAGSRHIMFVTADGLVFACGGKSVGQLGVATQNQAGANTCYRAAAGQSRVCCSRW